MSIHIEANINDIADTVLMPGDPLRAKWISDTFFEDAFCYNKVRGMLGYTGFYKGKRISVQGSGMGIPSAMIYFHELIQAYGVKTIIRVGTAGSFQKNVKIKDIVLAMSASTTSNINSSRFRNADYAPTADFELFSRATRYAKENKILIKAGNVLSLDEYYEENINAYKKWAEYGVLCAEMESAGLYTIASKNNVKALSILTISDSLVTGEHLAPEERETTLKAMIEIALHIS